LFEAGKPYSSYLLIWIGSLLLSVIAMIKPRQVAFLINSSAA